MDDNAKPLEPQPVHPEAPSPGAAIEELWVTCGHDHNGLRLNHVMLLMVAANRSNYHLATTARSLPQTSEPILGQPAHEVLAELLQELIRFGVQAPDITEREQVVGPAYNDLLAELNKSSQVPLREPHLSAAIFFLHSFFNFRDAPALDTPEHERAALITINHQIELASMRLGIYMGLIANTEALHPSLRSYLPGPRR